MIALPIPLIVSLVLGFLFVRAWVRRDRPRLFLALLAACALQGVVVSLCQHYGLNGLLAVQPVTATVIPPLAWVTLQTTAIRAPDPRRDLVHLAAPAFTAFCVLFASPALDVVVPGTFAVYGAAILVALRPGTDSLPLAKLEAGDLPALVWRAIAAALILSALSDVLIALSHAAGAHWLAPLIVSLGSSLWLLAIGALSLSQSLDGGEDAPQEAPAGASEPDTTLIAALESLMEKDALYLDPDLTLARLARRLRVPAKRLSAAVNRATGENVSRFINGFRIRHACSRLATGANVTAAMLDSGFNTKSNFNREFLRVTGATPSDWIAQKHAKPPA
ncbi:helix-turn-helix domain-containing protein [Rhizobiaceae bacterium BDR2-2]|uniref:Helix-turn-helix domain-containing protein n=1 Tax=Ectorhizobium quercum TaxID=2965071 RepID=A0AAE3MWF9_9HYPH|nr:helix-turn-helix domain-containing protein [Ectorhizobium quercum]MCX8995592.1 helix-turn-helix domain-containing protein [Ectorhizobium quercum]